MPDVALLLKTMAGFAMPDVALLLKTMSVAAAGAAAVFLVFAWPCRSPHPTRSAVGAVCGAALGFFLGCWVLGWQPRWPPREDQQRFVEVLLPATVLVELLAPFRTVPRWLAWTLRLALAAFAARVLLHDSRYLVDLAGPGSRDWTATETWLILIGLAASLAAVWVLLVFLAQRSAGRSTAAALSLACAAAAVAVMYSGYSSGGQLGFPLAAALAGAAVVSFVLPPAGREMSGAFGFGVVGLFGLLVMGRFFGSLSTTHAVLLFLALLLCWAPELPYVRKTRPAVRGILRVVLVAIPLAVAVLQARHTFEQDSGRPSSPGEPSVEDYYN